MWNVVDIGISGDGSQIFYIVSPNPCCSTPQEVGVISFDGTDRRILINWQLVVAQLNPTSLGEAPIITNPKIEPPFVLTKEKSAANVSASIATSNTLVAVGTEFLLDGLRDESGFGTVSLKPAGAGVFAGIIGNADIPVGLRIVRLKAEAKGSDGKRHATAVDLWPFAVAEGKDQAT